MTVELEVCAEMYSAVRSGKLSTAQSMVGEHPALLAAEFDGSFLHTAARFDQRGIAEWLIDRGVDVNVEDEEVSTPVYYAAIKGHVSMVQFLIESGADLAPRNHLSNPLLAAIYNGHIPVVEYLLRSNFDCHVEYRTEEGRLSNALSFAIKHGQSEIAEILKQAGCRMPVEGVDIPVNEVTQSTPSASQESDAVREILDHMANSVGPVESLALQEIVQVDDDVHVAINVIRPNENCPFTTLFTTGMSEVAMNVPEGQEEFQYAELVMYLPGDWQIPQPNSSDESTLWPFQWLRQIAYYPHLNETWLGAAHTIISSDDPPAPLGPGTDFTCLLLNADMMDCSPLELSDGRNIRFYTVMPIYTEERDFEIEHGVIPLLQKFEEVGIRPIVFPDRPNVAKM